MKVAFLVQAHNQPAHVARLINTLSCEGFYFFVHVDMKSDISEFRKFTTGLRNVRLLEKREKVFWGGFSQVQAALNLVDAARTSGMRFRRYCYLSGADFPIKGKAHIMRRFEGSAQQFIRVDRRLGGMPANFHSANIERLYFNDNVFLNPRTRLPAGSRRVKRAAVNLYLMVRSALPKRRFPEGLIPYHGSGWWCLTGDCVDYVLEFLNSHPEYVRFFRHVNGPDEIFFHTIVKSSPFAEEIAHDFERGTAVGNDHGAHYIDWNVKGAAAPKVLDESDLGALLESNALFARKFDEVRSRTLLESLERAILQEDLAPPG